MSYMELLEQEYTKSTDQIRMQKIKKKYIYKGMKRKISLPDTFLNIND